MTVELVESPLVQGGIRINVIAFQSYQQLAPTTEIPVGRDILFTARGGDGENGLDGGNGVDGMDGIDGVGATESSDATVCNRILITLHLKMQLTETLRLEPRAEMVESKSTPRSSLATIILIPNDSAGQGSNGADGGPGGTIEIVVHEAQTNLLLATSWDVKGGKGGMAGQHGRPGEGGKGGKGGDSHEWYISQGHHISVDEADKIVGVQLLDMFTTALNVA